MKITFLNGERIERQYCGNYIFKPLEDEGFGLYKTFNRKQGCRMKVKKNRKNGLRKVLKNIYYIWNVLETGKSLDGYHMIYDRCFMKKSIKFKDKNSKHD